MFKKTEHNDFNWRGYSSFAVTLKTFSILILNLICTHLNGGSFTDITASIFSQQVNSCLKTKLTFSVCQWSRNSNKFLNYFILTVCQNHVSGNSVLVFAVVFCSKNEGFSSLLFCKCAFNWVFTFGGFLKLLGCERTMAPHIPFFCRVLLWWRFDGQEKMFRAGKK